VSVAANIAHARIPTHPHAGSVLFAAFWPVFLFVAIEILSRVRWPRGWGWGLLRFGGLSAVAVFAAVVSYRHLSGLLTYYGEDTITSRFGPLAVDGLMVMATGALIATSRTRQATPGPVEAVAPAPPVAVEATPTPKPHAPKATHRPAPTGPVTPDQTRAYVAQHPHATQNEMARHLGISVKTLQRHLKPKPTKLTAVNGD
jgi:hypothetical protein